MGAWGHDSFENDDAGDWRYELIESADMSTITEALNAVTDNAISYLEAPDCAIAIAAAEVVAALHGASSANLPADVAAWVDGKQQPDNATTLNATKAISAILSKSELKELWEESEQDYPEWTAVMNDLIARIPAVA